MFDDGVYPSKQKSKQYIPKQALTVGRVGSVTENGKDCLEAMRCSF